MSCALCNAKEHARGLCGTHYDRWRRWGDPFFAEVAGVQRRDLGERFWEKVNKNGPIPVYAPHLGRCWIWTAAMRSGYGLIAISRTEKRSAHRVAYELSVGPIPDGMTIDHLCRVTQCVRARHLELVSPGENTRRGFSPPANNARKTHCKRGHEFTPENTKIVNWHGEHRHCRACQRIREERRYALLRAEA